MKKYTFPKISIFLVIISLLVMISSLIELVINRNDSNQLIFNLAQSFMLLACMFVPYMLYKFFKLNISYKLEMLYILLIIGSLLLGEICNIYGRIRWWDSVIHLSSGIYLGILWVALLDLIIHNSKTNFKFTLLFSCSTTIFFVIGIGAIWEMIEYIIDDLFCLNMQQFMSDCGTIARGQGLVGHMALRDTMKDLFLNFFGSLISSFLLIISYKRNNKYFKGLIRKVDKNIVIDYKNDYNEVVYKND